MNPTFHRPLGFDFEPLDAFANADVSDNFLLKLWYCQNGNKQIFVRVYIPKTLQPAFLRGDVTGIHIETLELNSVTAQQFPGQPRYLVLGVQLKDDTRLAEVPAVLQHAWRVNAAAGGIGALVGLALLVTPYAWAGAVVLVVASRLWARARSIPRHPFVVSEEHG